MPRKIREHHPPRWGLFGLAAVGLGSALAYAPFTNPNVGALARGLQILTRYVPMYVYAVLWLVAGGLVVVAAIRRRPGWEGVGLIVTMMMLWGSFLLIGWGVDTFIYGVPSRAYISAILYLGLGTYILGNVPPDPTPGSDIPSRADK